MPSTGGKSTSNVERSYTEASPESTAVSLRIYRAPTSKSGAKTDLEKAPFTPYNTRTYLSHNTSLDRSPAQLNTPATDKSKFLIKHTNVDGTEYLSEREFQRASEQKWDDKVWITDLNKWREQIFDRLFRHDPDYESKQGRSKWNMAEKSWLEYKIRKHGHRHGDQLNGKDWDRISKSHESRFAGTMIRKGEELLNGKIAEFEYQIHPRKAHSFRAQFAKMPEMKSMLQKIIDEFSDNDQNDISSDDVEDLDQLGDVTEVKRITSQPLVLID